MKNLFKQNPEEGTIHLVINELRRRLAEYRLMDKMFRERYKMDFDEFKGKRIVEESGHSLQVEEDYFDWELAIDRIKTISANLISLRSIHKNEYAQKMGVNSGTIVREMAKMYGTIKCISFSIFHDSSTLVCVWLPRFWLSNSSQNATSP